MSVELDWLIVGGGIHGVHIATRLLGESGVSPDRLCILDPCDQLLARWRTCAATTGMTHLRSPGVHHIGLEPFGLVHFAGQRKKRKRLKKRLFASPFDRPALALFNAHCDQVVESFGLAKIHVRDRAEKCVVGRDGIDVELSSGRGMKVQRLVLATGAGEQPEWPEWAPRDHDRIHHVFETGFDDWPSSGESVVVIGGGISAVQVALRMMEKGHRVHIVSRHALRRHQFDSDPGWLGPKFMERFRRELDFNRRRVLIAQARHRGSVPPDVLRALRRAIAQDLIFWHEGDVETLCSRRNGVVLRLSNHQELKAGRILLATGFASKRPGGAMVDALIASAGLSCADCGFPIVDSALRWHPRIHVSGPLAELELGPASRNIAGARRAGDRLVASLRTLEGRVVRKNRGSSFKTDISLLNKAVIQ